MPSIEEIAALAYEGPAAEQRGETSEDVRAYHRAHGERIRWWKGFAAPEGAVGPGGERRERNGRLYIEQALSDEVRALVTSVRTENFQAQPGMMPRGQSQISVLPDEVVFSRGDRVLLVEAHRAERDRGVVALEAVDGGAVGELGMPWVTQILSVQWAERPLGADDYELLAAEGERSRILLRGAASAGGLCLVEFAFAPLYTWQNIEHRRPPQGSDGQALAQIGTLTQEHPR